MLNCAKEVLADRESLMLAQSQDMAEKQAIASKPSGDSKLLDISVVIPTYNGAQRLPAVLEKLCSQINTETISWEILVADNNSLDETAHVVRQWQHQWSRPWPLRYCFAAEQGAAFARQRAVESARGSLVAFLDDDNLPEPDWVAHAFSFAQQHPSAGAIGSQIHGQLESTPPEGFEHIACYLAIIERGGQPHLYSPETKILPPGAGLVVRREAWLQSVPKRLFLNNKGKAAGLASEDLEAVLHIQKSGWEIWYNPAMIVHHQIPSGRLEKDYLITLFRCIGLSRFYIRMLRASSWRRPLLIPAYIANDLRRLALHTLRTQKQSQNELLESCEREYLASTVASPFFIARKAFQDFTNASARKGQSTTQIIEQIEAGFESDCFHLYQQQIFSTKELQGETPYHEVLVRLFSEPENHQARSLIAPSLFMPTAERYGLARTIDRWVIRTLFDSLQRQAVEQYQANYSINLSCATVRDKQFANFLADLLKRYQLPAKNFCFEIPEAAVSACPEAVTRLAHELREMGCKFVLDDFRHLRVLHQLPKTAIHYLKLSLPSSEDVNKGRVQLEKLQDSVKRTYPSGAALVAKGIENASMLDIARYANIPYVQGYQLEKPMPLKLSPNT